MEKKEQVKTFRDVIAWQKAHGLVLEIYIATRDFPDTEKFSLVVQMRRAAVSVTSNIVEGFARKMIKETLNFYNMANASLEELKCQILICKDIKLISEQKYFELIKISSEVGRVLHAWTDSQRANSGLSR
ncbi:four helix bundle protein [Candidatus Kuenenbacteria bacterium]|nr:four helix bundle protein [Candidatus Kuenenbacteria bacterium]